MVIDFLFIFIFALSLNYFVLYFLHSRTIFCDDKTFSSLLSVHFVVFFHVAKTFFAALGVLPAPLLLDLINTTDFKLTCIPAGQRQ